MTKQFSAESVREHLTTSSAKAAFDKINGLGPEWWTYSRGKDGIFVSAAIALQKKDRSTLYPIGKDYAETFEEAVLCMMKSLKNSGQRPELTIVVNAGSPARAEYKYDIATNDFVPA